MTKSRACHPDIGKIVLVAGERKNRSEWKHGLVCKLLKGKDQVVGGVCVIFNAKT